VIILGMIPYRGGDALFTAESPEAAEKEERKRG
jgi:hypothetical protein